MSKRILIVEDETDLAQILAEYLQRDGFVATTIADGLLAMAELRQAPPDLLLYVSEETIQGERHLRLHLSEQGQEAGHLFTAVPLTGSLQATAARVVSGTT